jgi:hypothetical protein
LYVTGATIADGRLYALDAAFGTLLTIDPAARAVVGALAIPGLDRPVGLAIKGRDIYIASPSGDIAIVAR